MDYLQAEQPHEAFDVHVIPDESTSSSSFVNEAGVPGVPAKGKLATAEKNVFKSFSEVSLVARSIGSSILKCESAMINQRLMTLQGRVGAEGFPRTPQQQPVSKRRRISESSVSQGRNKAQDEDTASDLQKEDKSSNDDDELLSLEQQAARIKRMTNLLKKLEQTQNEFLDEMIACAEDYNDRRGL